MEGGKRLYFASIGCRLTDAPSKSGAGLAKRFCLSRMPLWCISALARANMSLITFTTDFGMADWFVGTMKGVVAGINPGAGVIDITHAVAPGDIWGGAFILKCSYNFFPEGTIHMAVVDPGVGSARRAIAIKTSRYLFVGPDNGVLSLALAAETVLAVHSITNERYFLRNVSQTFHGRDVFSPVAAHLSRRIAIEELGPIVSDWNQITLSTPKVERGEMAGEIVYIDGFGNGLTNMRDSEVRAITGEGGELTAWLAGQKIPFADCYQGVPSGMPLALIGSSGFIEIAVNGGNAAESLALQRGTPVVVRHSREKEDH